MQEPLNKESTMNRTRAIQEDKRGEFYAEYDDAYGEWCVFGTESGFCYETAYDERQAEEMAEEMNRKYSKTAIGIVRSKGDLEK